MKLRGALFAAAVATLLWTVSGAPASAAPATPTARPPVDTTNLFNGACWTGLSFTQTSGAAVTADASIYCNISVDSLYVSVQLRRNGGPVASNACSTGNQSLSCGAGVACQPGAYQAFAELQGYTINGNWDYTTEATPVHHVIC